MKRTIAAVLVVLLIAGAACLGGYKLRQSQEDELPVIDAEYVKSKMEGISEFATAEYIYGGFIEFEDGAIPLITQKSFSMYYRATAKAGISLSEVDVDVTEEAVTVYVPAAQLISVQIDSSSVRFYNEKKALFNWKDSSDITAAIGAAENDFKENADKTQLYKLADERIKSLLNALLRDVVGGRALIITGK